jgi:hypothetical protein
VDDVERLVAKLVEMDREGSLMIGDVINLFTRDNIDPIIDGLPERLRDWVTWDLRDNHGPEHGPADGYILLEGVTVNRDHLDEYRRDRDRRESHMREIVIPLIRDWLVRHPKSRPGFQVQLSTFRNPAPALPPGTFHIPKSRAGCPSWRFRILKCRACYPARDFETPSAAGGARRDISERRSAGSGVSRGVWQRRSGGIPAKAQGARAQ